MDGKQRKTIAVFGSSEPGESDPLYRTALELGKLLAAKGFNVCTGGYGGIMEAASRGAREGGTDAIGVTVDIFEWRNPNRYISIHHHERDLYQRTKKLIDVSDGFIILQGKSGTVAELTFLWALHRAERLGKKPIVLLGDAWSGFLKALSDNDLIEKAELEATKLTKNPRDAVAEIGKALYNI